MLLYRVIPYLPGALPGSPGHPLFANPPQGDGRLDNPAHYQVAYFALEPSGAVGECFGDVAAWTDEMFRSDQVPGTVRALVTYTLPDYVRLLELDSALNLADRGLRPSQIIERNRSASQIWALRIYGERGQRGQRLWDGVRWWSYHRPAWRVVGYWGRERPAVLKVEPLDMRHPAVIDAAYELGRIARPQAAVLFVGSAGADGEPDGCRTESVDRRPALPQASRDARLVR